MVSFSLSFPIFSHSHLVNSLIFLYIRRTIISVLVDITFVGKVKNSCPPKRSLTMSSLIRSYCGDIKPPSQGIFRSFSRRKMLKVSLKIGENQKKSENNRLVVLSTTSPKNLHLFVAAFSFFFFFFPSCPPCLFSFFFAASYGRCFAYNGKRRKNSEEHDGGEDLE